MKVCGSDGDPGDIEPVNCPVHRPLASLKTGSQHRGGPFRPDGAQRLGAVAEGDRRVVIAEGVEQRRDGRGRETREIAGDDEQRASAMASAVMIPPSGPSPGCWSTTQSRPRRSSSAGSPPIADTDEQPAAIRASATRRAIATPPTGIVALSTPIRVLAPPHNTAPNALVIACRASRSSPVGGNAVWIELLHEQSDALGLVGLTDGGGHLLQAPQATEETAV